MRPIPLGLPPMFASGVRVICARSPVTVVAQAVSRSGHWAVFSRDRV
jgi:hypothetical protein